VSGLFRQVPAMFSGDVTHDPLHRQQRQKTWFRSGEARGETLMHLWHVQTPSPHVLRRWSDVIQSALVGMLHALLFVEVSASSALVSCFQRVTSCGSIS